MTSFRIFYSWQSDRPSKLCRQFISLALQSAASAVSKALSINVLIDSDTQGEPGTPPITDTILRKIRDSDAFIGDMTFVAATAEGKLLPNPNVMGEYGYALAQKGTRRILLVMNTAFGPAKELPFDLGHLRKPLGFEAPDGITDSVRRLARDRLATELQTAIKLVIEGAREEGSGPSTDAVESARAAVADLSRQSEYGFKPAIVSQPKVIIHLAPFAAFAAFAGGELNTRDVRPVIGSLKPSDLPAESAGLDENEWWLSGRGSVIPGRPNPESTWYSRIIQPGVFEMALLNIVANARDASPDGGAITVTTRAVHLNGDAAARHLESGDYVMLCVSDEGSGMPPHIVARATEPFFTTKGPGHGTGLGLAMAHGFVQQSGGRLEIDSEPGRGTTIRMIFPQLRPEKEGAAPATAKAPGYQPTPIDHQTAPPLILVVDDNREIAELAQETLTDIAIASSSHTARRWR